MNNKETTQKIKQIVQESNTEQECLDKLRKENMIVSLSEGRRYFHSLKNREEYRKQKNK